MRLIDPDVDADIRAEVARGEHLPPPECPGCEEPVDPWGECPFALEGECPYFGEEA